MDLRAGLRILVVAALLVAAGVLAGCTSSDSSGNGTSSPYAVQPDDAPDRDGQGPAQMGVQDTSRGPSRGPAV